MRPIVDDNEKTINRKSTESRTHKKVTKPKDLWREKERQRLLDQAKIEEFERVERAERITRLKTFPKTLLKAFLKFFQRQRLLDQAKIEEFERVERAERESRLKSFLKIFPNNFLKTLIVFSFMTASIIVAVYQYSFFSTNPLIIKPVIYKLKNGTTEEKLEAINFLNSSVNSNGIKPLIEAYPDEDESVNIAILKALASPWDSNCIEPLTEALSHKDSVIRLFALISLSRRHEYRVVPILFSALSDEDKMVRDEAYNIIRHTDIMIENNHLLPFFKESLFDKDEKVRELAARIFSRSPYCIMEDIEYFLPALKDNNYYVRKHMIIAIANCGYSPKVFDLLIDTLKNNEFSLIREEAAMALSRVGIRNPRALDYLIPVVLKDAEEPEVIGAALYSIIVIYSV